MIDLKLIWEETLANLAPKMPTVTFMIWMDDIEPLCIKDNILFLVAPTANVKATINKLYKPMIAQALTETKSTLTCVEIITSAEKDTVLSNSDTFHSGEIVVKSDPIIREPSPFINRYTFDNFVVGESNKLAFHASQTVANKPGSSEGFLNFNPLFIYGGVGLGKTHLMHSIGNYITKNLPSLKIAYVPTEKLTNEFYEALGNASSDKDAFKKFRDKYRKIDVLMLDDVQFLQKKSGLQDVVFHIFNELYQAGKQIILCSDRPPRDIGTLEERLRSRFEGGLLVDIGTPNLDMRVAIIRKKMVLENVAVNDEVVNYLAEKIDTNIRELEGALSKIILYGQLIGKVSPDIETAKEALKVGTPEAKQGIDSNDIIDATCSYFRINKNDLVGKKKTKEIVEARMTAIYLVSQILSIPLVTIGQIFGGRDHTTIIHSRDKIAKTILSDESVACSIKDIKTLLNI